MTDTIQTRIRQYLSGDNDEDVRRLLRDAADALDEHIHPLVAVDSRYVAPVEAWSKL